MRKRFFTTGLLTFIFLLLVSCASDQDRLAAMPEKFTTKIYSNGLKQFQLAFEQPAQAPDTEGDRRHSPPRKNVGAEIINRLEIKLKETGYCHQGYILSREFSTLSWDDLMIKGECVEGATDADRKLFP